MASGGGPAAGTADDTETRLDVNHVEIHLGPAFFREFVRHGTLAWGGEDVLRSRMQTATSVEIPDNVQLISSAYFRDCDKLEEVTFTSPSSLQAINAGAFEDCVELKAVSFPRSLQSIDNGVFKGCRKLKAISIPPTVTSISNEAFVGCAGLEVVSFPGWQAYPRYSRRFTGNIFNTVSQVKVKRRRGHTDRVVTFNAVDKVEVVDAPNSIVKQLGGVCRGIAKFKDLPDEVSGAAAVSAFQQAPATFRLRAHYFNPMTAKEDKLKWRTLTTDQKRTIWTTLCVRQAHTRPTNTFNLPVLPHEMWWHILSIVKKTDIDLAVLKAKEDEEKETQQKVDNSSRSIEKTREAIERRSQQSIRDRPNLAKAMQGPR